MDGEQAKARGQQNTRARLELQRNKLKQELEEERDRMRSCNVDRNVTWSCVKLRIIIGRQAVV